MLQSTYGYNHPIAVPRAVAFESTKYRSYKDVFLMVNDQQRHPEFERPPVVETVLGLRFAPLTAWTPLHLGLFWHEIRGDFPVAEIKEPIMSEPMLQGSFASMPLRAWYHDAAGVYLVQLQHDRLILNWRKTDGASYPRYHMMRPRFLNVWERLLAFLQKEGMDVPVPTICEVTYVDHVLNTDTREIVARGGQPFTFWIGGPTAFLKEGGTTALSMTVTMPGLGDLVTVQMNTALELARANIVQQLQFSSLTRPASTSTEDILAALDRAKDLNIRAFLEFTSEQLQELWGKRDAE